MHMTFRTSLQTPVENWHRLNVLQLYCVAIINYIYLQVIQKQLKQFWCKGVSSSRRIQLGSKFMAIKVDATSLAVGLEDGSIELWERIGKDARAAPLRQLR